jgi:hypothetical protein
MLIILVGAIMPVKYTRHQTIIFHQRGRRETSDPPPGLSRVKKTLIAALSIPTCQVILDTYWSKPLKQ